MEKITHQPFLAPTLRFGIRGIKVRQSSDNQFYVDDVSGLNRHKVRAYCKLAHDHHTAIRQLRDLLSEARQNAWPVSVAGSGLSLGGQTVAPRGLFIDMADYNQIKSLGKDLVRVDTGATWKNLSAHLNQTGQSIGIMQSGGNDFSVGGSLGTNVHGWQVNHPPLISSVKGFHLMKASGEVVYCDRTQNPDLFKAVIGGFGLLGVVLDVDLKTIPNERYQPKKHYMPVQALPEFFEKEIQDNPQVGMAYTRLSIDKKHFLQEASVVSFRRTEPPSDKKIISNLRQGWAFRASRRLAGTVFRATYGSERMKRLRWLLEKHINLHVGKPTRNQLQNESASLFMNKQPDFTDILHEYFIPTNRFNEFMEKIRPLIPAADIDLLNATVRDVKADRESLMPYARKDCFSLVLFFHQQKTSEAEARMQALTRELIDAARDCQGSYYLPYRPHATLEQFKDIYPEHRQFMALKAKHDLDNVFQNEFAQRYLSL